jgi:CO/xanthine dehydrogenase FAD-binding subunit
MKGYVPAYEAAAPRTLREALKMLAKGEWCPIAGGTDLMVLFEAGKLPVGKYLSLWRIPELKGISVDKEAFRLGALTTFTDVRRHAKLGAEFPLLAEAAKVTGGIAIQNRGTLGGNIANASPAADTPPALLVYNAELELVSASGTRQIAYRDFHLGYKKTALARGELISQVILPRTKSPLTHHYRKVGTRGAQAISKVCLAAIAERKGPRGIRLAFGSVTPIPFRAPATEKVVSGSEITEALIAHAVNTLNSELAPIDDIRSTRAYRSHVAGSLLREFLEGLPRNA